MSTLRAMKLFALSTLLLAVASACTSSQNKLAEQIVTPPTATAVPTPTVQPQIRPVVNPTPTPIVQVSINSDIDPPAANVDYLELDASEIVILAKGRFSESDSYVANVRFTSLYDGNTLPTDTLIEQGSSGVAHGNEFRTNQEFELLYVKGFSYERPVMQSNQPWLATGRMRLGAVDNLGMSIRGFRGNPDLELVAVREQNGQTLIEISGSFVTGSSGPPPAPWKRTMDNSATMIVVAETMLPVSIKINYVFENRDLETDVLMFVFGMIIESTISNYGQVTVTADHPRNLVPTKTPPGVVIPTVTPTTTPTTTLSPSSLAIPDRSFPTISLATSVQNSYISVGPHEVISTHVRTWRYNVR